MTQGPALYDSPIPPGSTVLVTGGGGYIGSVLTRLLLTEGYRVRVLDRLFFGPGPLADLDGTEGFELVVGDIRNPPPTIMDGIAAVLDLAAISNDPAGELDPNLTLDINLHGRTHIAHLARAAGVPAYVLASSCSVYGFSPEPCSETSPTNPLTTYARANLQAEQTILALATPQFCVTALRQATVYGRSPRMRFDLAVNGMTLGFLQRGSIPVLRDGTQWRPFVHVKDTARAFLAVLHAQPDQVNGQIFNVGSNAQNCQILPLARQVAAAMGVPLQIEWYGDPDHRSYQILFNRIQQGIGFACRYDIDDGVREIHQGLQDGSLVADDRCFTVRWYRRILEGGPI